MEKKIDEIGIPARSEIAEADKWDLSTLFINDAAWYEGLAHYEIMAKQIPSFQGTLGKSAESLADGLDFFRDLYILGERLGYYSSLRQSEDEGASEARTMCGKI